MSNKIKLLITDFDGTLVDTFEANYCAYRDAFLGLDIVLDKETYRECFGLRFDEFMNYLGINKSEIKSKIRELKKSIYPKYFDKIVLNKTLLDFLVHSHDSEIKVVIASTARKDNLLNVLNYFQIIDIFDLILTGEDVQQGKPHPDIYLKALRLTDTPSNQALVFEDTEIGRIAAERAGIQCFLIDKKFYGDNC